jgi:hypothetical protein
VTGDEKKMRKEEESKKEVWEGRLRSHKGTGPWNRELKEIGKKKAG